MEYPIKVNYEYTASSYKALKWLQDLPNLFAADFETASKYTEKEKQLLKIRMGQTKDAWLYNTYSQMVNSNGLSHPSYSVVTHLTVSWSDRDSYVILCGNDSIRNLCFNYLVDTPKIQIWHNCTFDFKHIYYHTNKIPKNFIDTRLLAKSILNDANGFRSDVGLKSLMGYAYGAWSVAKDNLFNLEDMFNEKLIEYAATDSAATYKLYQDIMEDLSKWKI